MMQLLHDRVLSELQTVLEKMLFGRNVNLEKVFQFEMVTRLEMNYWKMRIAMRQIGTLSLEMDRLDLIDKYRICLQNLIVGKRDRLDNTTGSKMSSIVKYLYNARNIVIEPRRSDGGE